jgi:glycosyltransferase involved in cell wall biosynthesis
MFETKKIAVVIPAYNEERLITRVLDTLPDFVDSAYIVDDFSTDSTSTTVKDYIRNHNKGSIQFHLLNHPKNLGVGAAIVTGYLQAVHDGYDIMAVMAGDAQMDPSDLLHVISPIARGEADYVKGNRLFTGEAWKRIPKYRYIGNSVLSLLTKIASGYWHVADSQTGYTAISKKTIQLLPVQTLYKRYGYPNHLLVMLNVFRQRVMDIPIQPVYGVGEVSGIKLHKVIPRMSWLLLKQFIWRIKETYVIRDFHPLVFFYLLGITQLTLCIPFIIRLLWIWMTQNYTPQVTALIVVFSFISGLQLLLFGMWFDTEYNRSVSVHPGPDSGLPNHQKFETNSQDHEPH